MTDESTGHDRLEARLSSAFEGVREWEPAAAGQFPVVAARARRRAAAARVVGGTAVLLVAAGVVALAAGAGRDPAARTVEATGAGAGSPTMVADASPSTTVPAASSTTDTTDTTVPGATTTRPPRPTPSTPPAAPPPTEPPPSTTVPPDRDGPPTAFARAKATEVQAVQGSYCWKSREGASLCADYASDWADGAPVLDIAAGEVVAFRWATDEQPKAVRADVYTRTGGKLDHGSARNVPADGGNPCRVALRLPPGDYTLVVSTSWAEGSATHAVNLHVG